MGNTNTYDSADDGDADRAQQRMLLVALNARDRALRRDGCGAWCISGTRGTVHTWGDGKSWLLFVACRSTRHWTATKVRLSFCQVIQDGEDEGCLRLLKLPTPKQANVLRNTLRIRKRMEFSSDDLERRRSAMTKLSAAQGSASATVRLPLPTPEETPILEAEPAK